MIERGILSLGVFCIFMGLGWNLLVATGGSLLSYGLFSFMEIVLVGTVVHLSDEEKTDNTRDLVLADIHKMLRELLEKESEPSKSDNDAGSLILHGGKGGTKDD